MATTYTMKILLAISPLRKYIYFVLIFTLGIYAQSSGLVESFIDSLDDWNYLLIENIAIVFTSGLSAVVLGVASAILMTRPAIARYAQVMMQFFNIVAAVPTLAILAIIMTLVGIGFQSAFIGLVTVTVLPVVRNTYQGILEVPHHLIEAGKGQGMTDTQILLKIQLPNALFVILAGVRTGFALNVGTSPLITLIAADSLGEFIFTGIALDDLNSLLIGSLSIGLLAIVVDFVWLQVQYWCIPKGINPLRS